MKGVFEVGKFYDIQKEGDSSSRFTWRGGCAGIHVDDYWAMDREAQVEDTVAEITTSISNSRVPVAYSYAQVDGKESTEEYTVFTVSAWIPHGPGEYFETYDDCIEERHIKVPRDKRLIVKDVLKVDLRTNEYELPEGYTVKGRKGK